MTLSLIETYVKNSFRRFSYVHDQILIALQSLNITKYVDSGTSVNSFFELEFMFAPNVAYRVYDEIDEGAIERADNGSFYVHVRLPEDNWLYGFLMSFGKDVEIIKPKHVRKKLAKKLNII